MLFKGSCHGVLSEFESGAVHSAPPFFVETLHGRSNQSLSRLPLHMHAKAIIPTFLTSNIHIGLCIPKVCTLKRLRSYEMFKVSVNVRIIKTIGLWGIVNFRMLRDAFPYRLARGNPLKEGVPYPQQSKVRTPPPHLC
jgi:hypothetical protein